MSIYELLEAALQDVEKANVLLNEREEADQGLLAQGKDAEGVLRNFQRVYVLTLEKALASLPKRIEEEES